MAALTPRRVSHLAGSPFFTSSDFPDIPSPNTSWTAQSLLIPLHGSGTVRSSRLRLRQFYAGSPIHQAETGSSSYGLSVCFQLLSTPHYCDAVTFNYRLSNLSRTGLSPVSPMCSKAHVAGVGDPGRRASGPGEARPPSAPTGERQRIRGRRSEVRDQKSEVGELAVLWPGSVTPVRRASRRGHRPHPQGRDRGRRSEVRDQRSGCSVAGGGDPGRRVSRPGEARPPSAPTGERQRSEIRGRRSVLWPGSVTPGGVRAGAATVRTHRGAPRIGKPGQ
jgi:hypothetical protein